MFIYTFSSNPVFELLFLVMEKNSMFIFYVEKCLQIGNIVWYNMV